MPYKDKKDRNDWFKANWNRRKGQHKQRKSDRQIKLNEIKSSRGCKSCEEKDFRCLDFHHRNPEDKSFTISQAVTKGVNWQDIENEISKCDVMCCNCHRKHHQSKN